MATIIVESEIIENKTVSIGILPKDLWEPISAFSNTDGGTINLGVEPSNKPVGIKPRYRDSIKRDVLSQCTGAFNQKIYPEIVTKSTGVISVYIPPAPAALRPIFLKRKGPTRGGRVRVGTSNIAIDEEWVKRFAIAARGGAELISYDADYKEYFDDPQLTKYLEVVKKRRGDVYQHFSLEETLRKLHALDRENDITLFGLLAFSNDYGLQELAAPTVNIAVTQYLGTSKVNPADVEETSVDDREFNGNTACQFDGALKFILSKVPIKGRVVSGGKRMDHLVIPEIAIREVLANAITHRDYAVSSSRIQVDIYTDRIEFTNPGRSLIPLKELEAAHPQTRNPLLMSYLRDLKITEHRGRGIATIKNSLKAAGLAEPRFTHRHNWFVATIYSSAFIGNADQLWLQKFNSLELKESQLNALVYAKHSPEGINNSEYREINNMGSVGDDIRAKKDLGRLVKLGIFEKTGTRRYTRYYIGKGYHGGKG